MCTFYFLYCVLYIVRLFRIAIHSVSFWDSVIRIVIVQVFHNQLLSVINVIVHYSDTGNVLQVFRPCKEVTFSWKPVPVAQYHFQLSKSINIILQCKFCVWFRLNIGFQRPIATIVASWNIQTNFSNWGQRGRDRYKCWKLYVNHKSNFKSYP